MQHQADGDMQGIVAAALMTATVAFVVAKKPMPALVTAIAGVAYFSMYRSISSHTSAPAEKEREVVAARYADWALTTPLILFMLLRKSPTAPWLAFVCGADALMIAAGYLGVVSERANRRAWFALSCAFFLPVLAAVGAFLIGARKKQTGGLWAAALILLVWLAYPVVWWMQYCVEGSGALSNSRATGITAALDVIAKVGFGVLI
jgi:bacteriorhodopsin